MRIVWYAFLLAVAWTVTLGVVAHSHALHSSAGMWTGVFGLPGVVVASWVRPHLGHGPHNRIEYAIMFIVNWVFYCTLIFGVLSVKRSAVK